MARPCSDGCGKIVAYYAQECFPVAPWDTPGLPPRRMHERCATHSRGATALCAYRDDDPAYCPRCHGVSGKCGCE